jgi:protein-disulfide isomerase
VTIVEFADYQCPHCKIAAESLKKVTEKFKGKVRLVFMDYPINPSGISRAVAEASHCALEQGKFWESIQLV